ncbi:MAG TPA: Holliday junction resolvase RuvX [Patescibacteria group bacterium]|nr:Holliday junction resolvase RuvX [Patescibacteria group bacterium]
MKLLGVDYGLKRIGLAISDGTFAAPLGKISDLGNAVRIVKEHEIGQIIIGMPDPHNPKVKSFGDRLSELTGVPVTYHDETFSTREARKSMIASGTSAKTRQQEIDQNAAAVILQSYIDSQNSGVPL